MTSGRISQHRNYGDLMARHERDIKLKRITRIFTYFLIIAILVILFFMVRHFERKENTKKNKNQTAFIQTPETTRALPFIKYVPLKESFQIYIHTVHG